jgi:hypothetical protein
MAGKGKFSLIDTTNPEDIIETQEQVGSIPFMIIDEDYGISGCYADMALVIKKKASKTGKVENGEDPTKVYTYYRWDELKYDSKLSGVFDLYLKTKRLNAFKGQRTKDIKDLIKIEEDLSNYVHSVLDINENDKFKEVCNLTDTVLHLKQQIAESSKVLSEYKKLIKDTELEFKEAKKIIVDNMPKHKNHTVKEEE